jgi:predicted AlkP superfamily pyrophosphatase or phosphodiesterase
MRHFIVFLFWFCFTIPLQAQILPNEKPKLVVGVVVDQMRYDYLTRFWDKFGEDGFKELVNKGFNFRNNHFNYAPTVTGPGHASVFTGTGPANHGIIDNIWYDKIGGEIVYCVEDPSVSSVGTASSAGKMSPHRMYVTTFADENRLHTQFRGKTIGVSLKDRGSILPAGHTANAAYWFEGGDEGKWISSTFYLEKLPQWVQDFNNSELAESYFKIWNTLQDISTYTESGDDLNNFEGGFKGKSTVSFPYDLRELREENKGFDLIVNTPYGNDLTLDFALAAIEAEELGKDEHTDVLTLSFSSTDKVGHIFGVNSREVQDTYLRLDRNIATLLRSLNESVGEGNYTIFLTADHGAGDVPSYLESVRIPAGYIDNSAISTKLEEFLKEEFQREDLIKMVFGPVYLDHEAIRSAGLTRAHVEQRIADFLLTQERISKVFTRSQLEQTQFTSGLASAIQQGFHHKRSGDVIFVLDPGVIGSPFRTGSTHGSGYNYDTHVPLIFYGTGIRHGQTTQRSEIVDIAPTISALLGIQFPNGATGKPLSIMLD